MNSIKKPGTGHKMKRRKAREYALQALFQFEFIGKNPDAESLIGLLEEEDRDEAGFFMDIVQGTLSNIEEIDSAIRRAAENWVIDRMAVVDRNILRSAAYELIFKREVPPAVVINEAIEIAKKYSSQESAAFINGILDKIAKKRM